jgi:hypothetical protein
MTKSKHPPLVICGNISEARCLREVFPRDWDIRHQGSYMIGLRVDRMFVTNSVNTRSDWYLTSAMTRLTRGSIVMRIILPND